MKATVPQSYEGRPLLAFLRGELKISGRLLTRLKQKENGITVNGSQVTVRYLLRGGDAIELADGDLCSNENLIPRDLPISVIFENADVIALNKPPHMPTHPSHGHADDTLANALAFRFAGQPFVFRPVNRLDRDTSGVVLAAKNQHAAAFFAESMRSHRLQKTYLAILDGELTGSGIINAPIRRERESIILRRTCSPDEEGAQPALTEYTVLDTRGGHSLVLVKPKTGRTHQIRVHFASLGAPITGDDLYGHPSPFIDRQALHALSLELDSESGEPIRLIAPPPEDIISLADSLGLKIPDEYKDK